MGAYLSSMGYLSSDIVNGSNIMGVPTTGNITVPELMGDMQKT